MGAARGNAAAAGRTAEPQKRRDSTDRHDVVDLLTLEHDLEEPTLSSCPHPAGRLPGSFTFEVRSHNMNEMQNVDNGRAVAVQALTSLGLSAHPVPEDPSTVLIRTPDGRTFCLRVEWRSRMPPAVAAALQLPPGSMLVTPWLGEEAGEILRQRGTDFVDSAGNAHLEWDGVLVDVRGRRRIRAEEPAIPRSAGRAFTRAGAQLVFVLLSWPEMASCSLRELARAARVSLGAAQQSMEDLASAGYVYDGPRGRVLARDSDLVGRWGEAYALRLAPKLDLGRFEVENDRWRRSADEVLREAGAQWGGELAATRLDSHLRPTTATVYADDVPAALVLKFRMRPSSTGSVFIRRRFWSVPADDLVVPAPLVWADLMISGDPRQREHAERLKESEDGLARLGRS